MQIFGLGGGQAEIKGRMQGRGEKEKGCPTNSFALSTLHACLRHGAFYFCLDVS